jgi:NADH:ubiquinone oxidoreductase subunit E
LVNKVENEELPAEKFEELGSFIDGLETKEGALIQVLYKAQEIFGYLPRDVQLFVARKLDVSGANVTGVVTFYSYFTTEKRGKHVVNVCMGTACFVKGAEKLLAKLKDKLGIEYGQTTKDGMFTLEDIRCLGTCGLAPVMTVDGKVYGHVTEKDIDDILEQYTHEEVKT